MCFEFILFDYFQRFYLHLLQSWPMYPSFPLHHVCLLKLDLPFVVLDRHLITFPVWFDRPTILVSSLAAINE